MGSLFKKKPLCIIIFIILATAIIACGLYVNDYYHASEDAIAAFSPMSTTAIIDVEKLDDDTVIYIPKNATKGLIFYPGGKVEYTAYEPLMKELASEGVMCVLIEMPFNLAILDTDAADGIIEMYPEIKEWYIGGHSLGGSAASMYLEDNFEKFDGLILLGSYSTSDLSKIDIKVLSIYGSEDRVMNYENYKENIVNLPDDFKEVIIEGGCHAYFGMYGDQEGDGVATISNEEQIYITADEILKTLQ